MTISSALQVAILLQVLSKTVSQYPGSFPFPGGSQMIPNMAPAPISPMPSQPFLPGGMGGAIPMHYPMQQKMPMVVMPYYSKSADKPKKQQKKKTRKRRRRKRIHFDDSSCDDDDDDDDSSSSSSDEFNLRRSKQKSKKRKVLIPVVSYVTKDGYVVYQKKIKKDKAKDWLEMGKRARESEAEERDDRADDKDDDRKELLRKLKKLKLRRHHKDRHKKTN